MHRLTETWSNNEYRCILKDLIFCRTKFQIMPDLKIQEAKLLFKKIHSDPKSYDLKINEDGITGSDDKISFRLYRTGERVDFEVTIDGFTFTNTTGEWNNAMVMLKSTIKKLEREEENIKIEQAIDKLRKYLSNEN